MGDALIEMASASPGRDFLGVEVHEPGIGRVLHQAVARGLANLRVIMGDAAEVLERCLPECSLTRSASSFPIPLAQEAPSQAPAGLPLLRAAGRKPPGAGRALPARDRLAAYAEHMLAVLEAEPGLRNLAGSGRFAPRAPQRPVTRFERRAADLGHPVLDLAFVRVPRRCASSRDRPGRPMSQGVKRP